MKARVVKRRGFWQAYAPDGSWLGGSSDWDVALALALGELVNLPGCGSYRPGLLSGVKVMVKR